jgi:hypothetical protein
VDNSLAVAASSVAVHASISAFSAAATAPDFDVLLVPALLLLSPPLRLHPGHLPLLPAALRTELGLGGAHTCGSCGIQCRGASSLLAGFGGVATKASSVPSFFLSITWQADSSDAKWMTFAGVTS